MDYANISATFFNKIRTFSNSPEGSLQSDFAVDAAGAGFLYLFNLVFQEIFVTLLPELQMTMNMTAAARTIKASPMAPIIDMVKDVDIDVMHAAVEYLNEAIHQAEEAQHKAENEFLAKKMAENKISPEIDELVDWLRLTPEEAADERTRWILGFDSK